MTTLNDIENNLENNLLSQEKTTTIHCVIVPPYHPLIFLAILYTIWKSQESIDLIHKGTINVQTSVYIINLLLIITYFIYKNYLQ